MLMTEVHFLIIQYLFYPFPFKLKKQVYASAFCADPAVTTVSAKLCLQRASGGDHTGFTPAFNDS